MKMLKRTLSVFLAVLMLFTGVSSGVVAYAAEMRNDTQYRALAYSFFNYTIKSAGYTSSYVVDTDENGYPSRSIVGNLDQYTISNESSDYAYACEHEKPIRAISYEHRVTANDNSKGVIRNAATAYLSIVDELISYEYGIGLYTIPMISTEVAKNLKFTKADDGEYLFLDGYTYLINAVGEIRDRSPEKTYEVVDGEIVELETDDSWLEPYEADMVTYDLMTLYDYCHVETIIDYFSGNFTSVNSGNWFHTYSFHCKTDVETVLINEALVNSPITIQELTIDWKMTRQYDDSGTEAQYYNDGYTLDKGKNTTDYTRQTLVNLEGALQGYFTTYLGNAQNGKPMLSTLTNQNLLNIHYDTIATYYDTFRSLSNEAIIAVYGQAAFSYVNLVTQLTPIVNYASDPYNAKYWPKHTYTKYFDDNGKNVVYQVDAQKVTTIVSTIDDLLNSERVGSILKLFFDFTGPEYSHMAYYYDAQNAKSAQDLLKIVIADFLYNDDIINMLLGMLYPMVTNLLDDLITDEMINGAIGGIWSGLVPIVEWVVENDEGWLGLIYGVLTDIGVGLTPAGVAYVWNKYGYNNNSYFTSMTKNHDHLKAAKGGTRDHSGNGWYETPGYYSIGVEGDEYHLDRWKDVDTDLLVWDINGSRERFQNALCAILAPLSSLLSVVLGNQRADLKVGQLAFDIILYLEDLPLYNNVLLPLLEALGIPNLASGSQFESLAGAIVSDANRNKTTIENFLNQGLLTPLLDWVENVVLDDPIGTILNLLPNVSYYLTSGAVLSSVNGISIPLKLKYAVEYGAVYTLVLGDLLGSDTLAFLDSLQGILDLIGFDVDTGIPIVGYHAKGDAMVYKPGMAEYNPDVHTEPVTEAYISSAGMMNIYQNDIEFTTLITGLDADGNFNEYVIRDDVGWANIYGNVVTERNNETATPEEYNIPVQQYYSYTVVVDEETGESITYNVRFESMVPDEYYYEGNYSVHESVRTLGVPASLPPIMDYKLQATGTVETVASGRYSEFVMSSGTWAAYTRKYINVQVGGMETEGLVLLFLFRYLFSALMYRSFDATAGKFTSDYTLLDAFGLDAEMLNNDLFAGLRLQDIINNIALHPDEAIAALYELFYKNEFGSLYEVVNGFVQENSTGYTYDIEYVDYRTEEILTYAEKYNDYNYGTSVLYNEYWSKEKASYVVDNLDEIVDNVLKMLKLENMDTLGDFLSDLVGDLLFKNDMITTIADMIYGLLGGLGGDIDILGILDAALDVKISKQALADALYYEFGESVKKSGVIENEDGTTTTVTSVYTKLITDIAEAEKYESLARSAEQAGNIDAYNEYKALAAECLKFDDNTFNKMGVDSETGEDIVLYSYDWGYNNPDIKGHLSDTEIFLRAASAVLSPAAFLIKFLFAGEDLSVLNLITIPGYETFYYSWIPLMETLGATDGLIDFKQYFTRAFAGESATSMNCDTIYYLVKPLFGLIDRALANPVETVFGLIPNLLFFISIGGLNDVLNNLVHFVYVLLDILGPVFDAYPLLNSLLSNLNIGGMQLNLSVPLDFDFNQLVNQLLEGILGESLAFDIENKNIVLGTQEVEKEVFVPTLDADGNEQLDEEGNVIGTTEMQTVTEEVYAVGKLNIKLPYIDFSTLCAGTIQEKMSISGKKYIYLNSAGGADLITLVLRLVMDTLFFEDNAINVANFLIGFCQLDDEEGSDELLMEIFVYLNNEARAASIPDVILGLIYTIYTVLVPVADMLGSRFANVDFSITELFEDIGDMDITKDRISQLLSAGEDKNPTLSGFARLIELLKQFFAKIGEFFRGLFGG